MCTQYENEAQTDDRPNEPINFDGGEGVPPPDDSSTSQPPNTTHEVILQQVRMTNRGAEYSVTYRGEVICISRDPEFAACRELIKRGITGRLATRWKGAPYQAMTMGIAWGATKQTKEDRRNSPKTSEWSPFEGIEGDPNDLSASHGSQDSAETGSEVA